MGLAVLQGYPDGHVAGEEAMLVIQVRTLMNKGIIHSSCLLLGSFFSCLLFEDGRLYCSILFPKTEKKIISYGYKY